MGSSGYEKFGTYHFGDNPFGSNYPGGIGGAAGGGGEISCPSVVELIRLEDVALSEYYQNNKAVPPVGSEVELDSIVNHGRLAVKLSSTEEVLGNMPTEYNYLLTCLQSGMYYSGTVVSSGEIPIPYVVVTLYG